MITGKQIRAARALLDLSQDELANLAGLTKQGISKIEDGSVQPREGTLADIVTAFTARGIEFLDNQGVRFRPEGVDIFNGPEGLAAFFDQVYNELGARGGLVCVSGVDEDQFARHHGKQHATEHLERMKNLCQRRDDIEFRVLLREGDRNFLATEYCSYKWQAKENFVATPFYVFGDALALITFEAQPAPKIMIIRSSAFADAYRRQFDVAWRIATNATSKDV